MDINQLQYFITIVDSDCNLSRAARKIHITQSALSQLITNYENQEELELFHRKNGRLTKLTSSGQLLYDYAVKIVETHEEMNEMVRCESAKQKGSIRIGIPTNLMNIYFSGFLPQFIQEHHDITIEIVEDGSIELRKMLINGELNYAILVDPTNLAEEDYEEHVMYIDEFRAYMTLDHPLVKLNKLNWSDLTPYGLSTFNSRFTSYDLIKEKLQTQAPGAHLQFTSLSWEYLLEISRHSDAVCLIPPISYPFINQEYFTSRSFHDPVPFIVHLCRPIKSFYGQAETLLYEAILKYFYQPIE